MRAKLLIKTEKKDIFSGYGLNFKTACEVVLKQIDDSLQDCFE